MVRKEQHGGKVDHQHVDNTAWITTQKVTDHSTIRLDPMHHVMAQDTPGGRDGMMRTPEGRERKRQRADRITDEMLTELSCSRRPRPDPR